MYCKNCGAKIPEESKQCPECGTQLSPIGDIKEAADKAFDNAEKSVRESIDDVKATFNGATSNASERLSTNRSLIAYILLSIVTCGIYSYYFIYKIAHDLNIVCEGDGAKTGGLVKFIVLSALTCGIYAWFWYYNIGNRLAANAPRYNLQFQENGTTILLWIIFGSFICGIGPFVAMHIIIKNVNAICAAYNKKHFEF